jgi:Spy/CpxP family protein refolding chaperone
MEEILFAPELVMRNQQAIGLRDDQQSAIRAEMLKATARFTDLQWQQSAQVEILETLCRKQPADEKAVLAQFDKLLSIEGEIKRLNFASLVRVKNILTPEQQAQLRELERQGRPRPDDQQRRPGGAPPGDSNR